LTDIEFKLSSLEEQDFQTITLIFCYINLINAFITKL